MFELLEGYDVQAERKEARLKGREEGREEGIKAIIKMCKKFGYTANETKVELQEQFEMKEAQAEKYVELFW